MLVFLLQNHIKLAHVRTTTSPQYDLD